MEARIFTAAVTYITNPNEDINKDESVVSAGIPEICEEIIYIVEDYLNHYIE